MRAHSFLAIVAGFASMLPSTLNAAAPTFSFSTPQPVNLPGNTGIISIGDINEDGNTDILNSSGIFWGDGKGNFNPAGIDVSQLFDISSDPFGTTEDFPFPLVDLDGDGHLDFIQYVHGVFDYNHCDFDGNDSLNIFLGDGKGHFTFKSSITNRRTDTESAVIGDFNKDGKPDLAVIGQSIQGCLEPGAVQWYASVMVLTNQGGGNFSGYDFYEDQTAGNLNFNSNAQQILTGDFNGDGKPDLAFPGYKYDSNLQNVANNLQVLNGNGDGTFVLGAPYTFDSSVGPILVADLNGDKRSDLIVSLGAKNVPGAVSRRAILLAKQTTGFYWDTTILHNEQWGAIDTSSLVGSLLNNSSAGSLVDLNHDGKLDLTLLNSPGLTADPSYLEILGGEGGTSFAPPLTISTDGHTGGVWAIRLVKGGPIDILIQRTSSTGAVSFALMINKS